MPKKKFVTSNIIKLNEYSIAFENEKLKPCPAYDGGGPPGEQRIVLRSGERAVNCSTLEEICRAAESMGFPMLSLATKHPGQLTSMITSLLWLGRPIQHRMLWWSIEWQFRVRMADVIPAVVGNELRWFELQWPPPGHAADDVPEHGWLLERRLSLDSFILTGERLGQHFTVRW